MAKKDLVAELKDLTGEEVNKDSYTEKQLEQMVKEARGTNDASGSADAGSADTTPEDTSGESADTSTPPTDTSAQNTSQPTSGGVLAYLGPNSPAGRLVLGNTTIRRARAGEDPKSAAVKITREQFKKYAEEYDVKEVK